MITQKKINDKFIKGKKDVITAFSYFEGSALCSVIVDYDIRNKKLKLYFISPDKSHLYISVDGFVNQNNNYQCEIGNLYLNEKHKTVFEDTPNEIFFLEKKDCKIFNNYYNSSKTLDRIIISEIINSYNNLDKDLVF
jgi:hypothetical protein